MSLSELVKIKKYNEGRPYTCEDEVVRESPVTLFVNDRELATLVCTPDSLQELALGFLFGEGILSAPQDLKDIKVNINDGLIWVDTASPTPAGQNFLKRHITTCCGKGRPTFYFINDARGLKPVPPGDLRLTPDNITSLAAMLEDSARLFRSTGGAHGAALASPEGIITFYEDVGRHNAVDKVPGFCFLNNIPLSGKILVLSGRISAEILIKAARLGVPMIVSRSAPTSLALQMADELGITVAGFVRGRRFNLYTHPERIKDIN